MHKEHAWEGSNRGIRMLESTGKAPIWEEGCSHPCILQRWLITLGKGQLLRGISPIRTPLVILPFNLKQSVCYYPTAFYLKFHLLSFPPPWNKNDEMKTLSLLFVSFFPWYSSTKHGSGWNAQLILMDKPEDMQMHVISCRILCMGEQKHLTFYSTCEPCPQYCLWLMTIQSTTGNLCGVGRSPHHTIHSGVHS